MRDSLSEWWARRRGHVSLALVCLAIFLVCRSFQEKGHGWGDDFALYIDQARGLTDGSIAEVTGLTRYALDNSAYNSFSAYVYPWVFPLLLAPIVALRGIDYSALKLVPTLSLVIGLFFLHRVVRHRAGDVGALIIMLTVGLNNVYIGYTDAVLSDLTFFMVTMIVLWWLDRTIRLDRLFAVDLRPLIALGALAAVAFNTRREGFALILAVAAAQAAHWRRARALADGSPRGWRQVMRTAAAPYLTFAVVAIVFQLVLPSQPFPRYDAAGGTGWHNVRFNLKWYRLPLAEMLGLKDVGPHRLLLLGSHALADVVFWVFIVAVLIGLAWRALVHARTDAHVAVAFLGMALIILSPPFREGRYLLSGLPFLLYFAWQGIHAVEISIVALVARRKRAPVVLAQLGIAGLALCMLTDTWGSYKFHRDYTNVEWGPADPRAQQAFDAVIQYTDGRDVIAFYQARTMNLYTHRKAIQGNSETMMLNHADWYLMVRDSDYIQTNLTDRRAADLGFEKVWENGAFVLWRIPPRYPPLPIGPGPLP